MYFASRHSKVHWLTPTGRIKLMACSRRSKTGVLPLIVMSVLSSKTLGTTRFVLKVYSLLARRAWRNALSGSELTLLAGPASKFAESALDRLRRRVKKRGEQLAELTDEERHELRIALKNLRYGVEFFGSLFDRRRIVRRYAGAVSLLQDLLGAHNDVATSRQFLDDLPEGMEHMSGFILGWYARGTALADADLFDASTKFKKIEPFWR